MIAKLKHLHSPDTPNLASYSPEDKENFRIFIKASVDIDDQRDEGKIFDIEVCTPQWLLSHRQKSDIIVANHLLIVFTYDYKHLYTRIEQFINTRSGDTRDQVIRKISELGRCAEPA